MELKFDENGLIPAIVQDHYTKEVLTLAYMNAESLAITIDEGRTCFWSRSRQELWRKGETSGNVQHVVSITADCDADALAMTEGYFRVVGAVAEKRPTILGHIDLITKLNAGNRFFDEESPRYRAAALEALHRTDPNGTLLEINTGGVARGYRTAPYPALFLLREWRAVGGAGHPHRRRSPQGAPALRL